MSSKSNDKKLYKCYDRECEEKLESSSKRLVHIDEVHRGRILCPYENCKTFLRVSSFRNHVNEFHEKKVGKEQCTLCGQKIWKRSMSDHLKRCSDKEKKKFSCTIKDCRSSFVIENDLIQHIDAVHASPIKCYYKNCKSFVKPAGLSRHVRMVHENLKKACHNCGKQISINNLQRHVKRCISNGE